jgi:hypothetical protein
VTLDLHIGEVDDNELTIVLSAPVGLRRCCSSYGVSARQGAATA